MNRREFILTTSAALTLGGSPRAKVVDAHLHCFAGKGDARFPYHPDGPYKPEAPATPEHLLKIMDGAGVDHAIVVHPEPYQDDHRYLEHCLELGKGRLKGTALFFAGRHAGLAELAKRVPLVAARIHAYAPDRLPPFRALGPLWKAALDSGLAVQIHFEPRYAGQFEPYLDEFKAGTVIVDHLGRPLQGTPEEHERVIRWGERPNVVMKLSAYAPETQYPHRNIAPIVKRLADAYGADRMIFGGGFGPDATSESYGAEREKARKLIAHLSEADQAKVLGGTAARLFKF
jgi:predicted TIM-barrel fold metal-dependent hydrolase